MNFFYSTESKRYYQILSFTSNLQPQQNDTLLSNEWLFLIFFHGIFLMCMSSCLKSATIPPLENETDHQALLDFKRRITKDPLQIMSSWNDSTHFCNWLGVTCSPSNKRVMVLNLKDKKLSGSIPPSMGNLTYLIGIEECKL